MHALYFHTASLERCGSILILVHFLFLLFLIIMYVHEQLKKNIDCYSIFLLWLLYFPSIVQIVERWKTTARELLLALPPPSCSSSFSPGLDVEFHMRRIKYLFESLRIKKCGIWFRPLVLHAPNWLTIHVIILRRRI